MIDNPNDFNLSKYILPINKFTWDSNLFWNYRISTKNITIIYNPAIHPVISQTSANVSNVRHIIIFVFLSLSDNRKSFFTHLLPSSTCGYSSTDIKYL